MKFKTFNQLPLFTDGFFLRHLDDLARKDALVIHNPPEALVTSPVLLRSRKSLEEHIAFIRENGIKKAIVVAEDLGFLIQCPTLEYLWVLPSMDAEYFDETPIYSMPNLKWLRLHTTAGLDDRQVASVDYSRFRSLQWLSIHGAAGHRNVHLAGSPVSLLFQEGYPQAGDLRNTFPGAGLRNFCICQAPIVSLSGLEAAGQLRRLELSCNRRLTDISALRAVKDTLACLEIDTCGKIRDFSVLGELENLEYLILKGSNVLPGLSFLDLLPKLKHLHVTMNVADGDLSPCLRLPYARIQNRKHYSHKDQDLPKAYSNPDDEYPFRVP